MAKTIDTGGSLDSRWNEMTMGTYIAIQDVRKEPDLENVLQAPVLENGYAFKLLCELAFIRKDKGISYSELVELGPEALIALEYAVPRGLIDYSDKVTLSSLGKRLMQAARTEVNHSLGRDLPSYFKGRLDS